MWHDGLAVSYCKNFVAINCNCLFLFQESHAFSLYNKGLSLQRQGDLPGAEQAFKKILQIDVVDEVQLQNLGKKLTKSAFGFEKQQWCKDYDNNITTAEGGIYRRSYRLSYQWKIRNKKTIRILGWSDLKRWWRHFYTSSPVEIFNLQEFGGTCSTEWWQ